MSRNLLKGGYIIVSKQEPITIDGNEAVARRLEEIAKANEKENVEVSIEEGFSEGIDPAMVAKLVEEPEDISALCQERERILSMAEDKAKEEAERILQNATEESKKIIEEAKEQGYQEGYQNGSAKAIEEAKTQYLAQCTRLEQREKELESNYNKKLEEMESVLVDKLTDIFGFVTGVRVADDRQAIISILNRAMQSLENGRNYIIHVSKDDYDNVKEHVDDIVRGTGLQKETFEIVEDVTLNANACFIESEAGIWDCGLETQMELLQKQLRILSYEPE